jgi:Uma2 family endonuclease
VSPAPAIIHQLVLQRLGQALGAACPPEYLVLPGLGVEMGKYQYRIPDLAVVRVDAFGIDDKSVTEPPVLAIEIASPSTAMYDRNRKKEVYAGLGIASYWIVMPILDQPRLTAFELRRGSCREIAEVSGAEVFAAARPLAVEIVPSALVAGPWQN